ncbi:cytochrome C biogenesis protein [Cytobacillus firmus]|uniref:peroxiredoxin family protein n=1 Tax=Cytobacillus firmus TaxID=1399 RepID=UPI00077C83EA|nr:redoxin domain-containing protein [Cytobacillus firmus]MBG9541518.1 cytochrome C biogenesis protein [Cytobacillus firmus]MBG9546111.1 cytochrome C biogenesis protein [Cytobacillus firmus]MBG9551454.1 cytochrome C biogenesis protein [Cytobacillus firmus]MBG9556743.1 cytochrome C biogenesis protein [Cytobacillus firmus]MBG9576136.1 cytochrome C biogenesis protein [Cytobacillus firmus]
MYKKILVIIGLVGMIAWGVYDYSLSANETKKTNQVSPPDSQKNIETGVDEGKKAPDFQLQTLDGKEIKLSDMAGKKVILNFWATWCPPCKAEMPHMQEFYVDQKGNKVEILAVNLTTAEKDSNNIGKFVNDYGLTFPILLDSNGEIGETYQAFSIPTSYIIDTKGIIRKKIVGPMDKEMMSELINSIE